MIFLDYMATTPVEANIAEAMQASMVASGDFVNPSSAHCAPGRQAMAAITGARQQVADLLGVADASAITFTSGATEANNLALMGAALAYQHKGKHIISSACEHAAVLNVLSALQKQGFSVTYCRPNENGLFDVDDIAKAVRADTILASFMWANNEIGVINDIPTLAALFNERGVLFHVDAAQAVGKCAISLDSLTVDMLSLSAHKFYGPKGVGCLYVRPPSRLRLQPLMYGAGQEAGLRPGTLPTHQLVGLGLAAEMTAQRLEDDIAHYQTCQQYAWQRVAAIDHAYVNGDTTQRISNNVNFSLLGHTSGELARQLAKRSICVATGPACHSQNPQPSHVLRALGHSVERASSALRISFGRATTLAEIAQCFDVIDTLVAS